MTRLVLIRHGEAQSAVDGVVGGHQGCTGLSAHGRRQVEALRDRLARTGEPDGATALYTSALPRAIETATILAPALHGLSVTSDCELCELHVGDELDGMPWDATSAKALADLRGRPFSPAGTDTESWVEFVVRAGRRLLQLGADHEGATAVICCHGDAVDASFCALGGLALQNRLTAGLTNTGLTEWVRRPDGGWRLERHNDVGHLAGARDG